MWNCFTMWVAYLLMMTLAIGQCVFGQEYQVLNTTNRYHYIPVTYDFNNSHYAEFDVKACNDAHINLMADVDRDLHRTYEIVIGGWQNSKSVIRKEKQERPPRAQKIGRYLDCHRFKRFWISWSSHTIKLGTPDSTLMSYSDPFPYEITGISVSTGWGATGVWHFYNPNWNLYQLLNTPNRYHYVPIKYNFGGHQGVKLEVKAHNDAHINLMADVNNDIRMTYEIVIGGWGNTKSVIRKVKQERPPRAQRSGRFLSSSQFRTFFINWDKNVIRVDTPHMSIMHYKDPSPYPITGISVSTGWGATGSWKVYNPDALP